MKKILVLVIAALILFEITLRVSGFLLANAVSLGAADAEITILAEGDSFTYGIGGLSFPAQLQEIFDERLGPGRVRMVNEGIPGLTSGLLVERMEEHLIRYRPDAVVVIVGENNTWNSIRLSDPDGILGWGQWLERILLHSRVFKFFKVSFTLRGHRTFSDARAASAVERAAASLATTRESIGYPEGDAPGRFMVRDLTIWLNLGVHVGVDMITPVIDHLDVLGLEDDADAFPTEAVRIEWGEAIALEHGGRYDEAVGRLELVAAAIPEHPRVWYRLGTARMRTGSWDDAIAAFEVAASLPGARPEVWFSMGHAHKRAGRSDEALSAWHEGLQRFPLHRPCYHAIGQLLNERGNYVFSTLEYVSSIAGIERNPMHQYLLRLREHAEDDAIDKLIAKNTALDVERIITLSRAHGAEVIFASYPHIAFDEISETTRRLDSHYIDFQPMFAARFSDRDDYLSDDECHCNSVGYRFMAEHFYTSLVDLLGIAP